MDKDLFWFLVWWVGGGLIIALIVTALSSCSATYIQPISGGTAMPSVPAYVYIVPKLPERIK